MVRIQVFKRYLFVFTVFGCLVVSHPSDVYGETDCRALFEVRRPAKIDAFHMRGVSANFEVRNSATTVQEKIEVQDVVERKGETFYKVAIGKTFRQGSFYSPATLFKFIEENRELSGALGFRITKMAATGAEYLLPTPETLNKRVEDLRKQGILPKNGLQFKHVLGETPDLEYADLIRKRIIPVGTNSIFFHDMNVHAVAAVLLPVEAVHAFTLDIAFSSKSLIKLWPLLQAQMESYQIVERHFPEASEVIDRAMLISRTPSEMLDNLKKVAADRIETLTMLAEDKRFSLLMDSETKADVRALVIAYRALI